MKNRVLCFVLMAIVLFGSNSTIAFACDEHQTTTYLGQLLFGNNADRWSSDDNMIMLADALYLCSEQSDGKGQDKLEFLKEHKVSGISSISNIDINSNQLIDYSHKNWYNTVSEGNKTREARKSILKNTVSKVFGTTLIDNTVGSLFGSEKKTKYESFAALLYYSHILFDYLADDPEDTRVFVNGEYIDSYSGSPEVELNGDEPFFTEAEKNDTELMPKYNKLDDKRTSVAFARIGINELEQVTSRKDISGINPPGWNQKKEGYEDVIVGDSHLYDRCHLIAHMLTNNDEKDNLITGTQYLNRSMQAFELGTADYIRETGNHVLYRATPVYVGDNEIASGVQLEAWSIEDNGVLHFNRYLYNVQPGVDIDYSNGASTLSDMTVGSSSILPFAKVIFDGSSPDLIYAIDEQLEILFSDQATSDTYSGMEDKLKAIALEARESGYFTDRQARNYIEGKAIQYKYFNVLKAYVPLLLANEEFFASVFN